MDRMPSYADTFECSDTHESHTGNNMAAMGPPNPGILDQFATAAFVGDTLAKDLNRHQITGIAFSAAVGIGMLQSSGEILALGGPIGALLAFLFASLIIFSVMRCLAEMVSVRPVQGALMSFPADFVDEALGFTVGVMYWLANCMSMTTLTIAAAVFSQYWGSSLGISSATFVFLVVIMMMNVCGVKIYGSIEWVFKWLKIALLLGVCVLAIVIKAGVAKSPDTNYTLVPGYSSPGFGNLIRGKDTVVEVNEPAIGGTGGKILAVWTCLNLAMFQFMGGEMVIVTSSEARAPRHDLPTAARYMYLLPITFYLFGIILVGLCVDYRDENLFHPHFYREIPAAWQSPFVVATMRAGIEVLPGFLNGCFLFSALTAANSALYASSRTLFFMARKSSQKWVKNSLGRTNRGGTPIAAILFSFLPGGLAFLSVRYTDAAFREPLHVLGRLYTGPLLCIYASECLTYMRFKTAMKRHSGDIDMASYYHAHWQPLWAILGLILCVMLVIVGPWNAIYDLVSEPTDVPTRELIVDLVFSYIGPILFVGIYVAYKLLGHYGLVGTNTTLRAYRDMGDLWYVRDELGDLEDHSRQPRGCFSQFLSFIL